jgi:homoserine kinase
MIRVKVPATSANMGPGFDCLGIALNLYNYFFIEEIKEGLNITGCDEAFRNDKNLVYTSMMKCFEKIGYVPKGISIKIQCDIPISRGLGSSAACILGGVLAANELTGSPLSIKELLEIATIIEGHPDNITPALFGGMTVSVQTETGVCFDRINLSRGMKFCALIPNFKLSTSKARAVLPTDIPYKHATFNVGRTALLISAMISGNFDLIHTGCEDKLHQNYRSPLIENYEAITYMCKSLGSLGVFLSGAGPTIMVILKEEDNNFYESINMYFSKEQYKWQALELMPCFEGSTIERFV